MAIIYSNAANTNQAALKNTETQSLENLTQPSIASHVIGSPTVLSFGSWQGEETLSGELRRDGQIIATGLSDGHEITWLPADDLVEVVLVVTATGLNGIELEQSSASVVIRYAPPIATTTLREEFFDVGDGPQLIDVSIDFIGDDLTFSTTSNSATIDPQSGIVTAQTDAATAGMDVIILAQNSGGSASRTVTIIVESEEAGEEPIVVYYNSFASDASGDFLSGTPSLTHDGTAEVMKWGAVGNSWESGGIDIPITPGRVHQVLFRNQMTGSGNNTEDTFVRLISAGGGELWSSGDIGTGTHLLDIPASGAANRIRISGMIRGDNNGKQYVIEDIGVWDVTESGGFPAKTGIFPQFWAVQAYVGEPSYEIDFASSFSGSITGYNYAGPEPHSWNGSVLTITPDVATSDTVNRGITALNGALESIGTVWMPFNIKPAPETLADRGWTTDFRIEVNRPLQTIDINRQVSGGALPLTFSKLSGPSYAILEENGIIYGDAPAAPETPAPLIVRVTDARGDTLDMSMQWTVVAANRTPTTILASGGVIFDAIRAASPGDVIQLADGGTYTWGNSSTANQGPQDNPIVVVGPATAVVTEVISQISNCRNVIFEGFSVNVTISGTNKSDRIKTIIGMKYDCQHIYFYDLNIKATRNTVTVPGSSADGINWLNTETFITMGTALSLGGIYPTAHGCVIEDVYAGVQCYTSSFFAVVDCQIIGFGVDGLIAAESRGGRFQRNRVQNAIGNYTNATHRDLCQTFANNTPMPKRFVYLDNFMSTGGTDQVQGHLLDLDAWATLDRTPEVACNYKHIHRGNVMLSSTDGHGFQCERMLELEFNKMVVLGHPDVNRLASFDVRRASQVDVSNSVIQQFSGAELDKSTIAMANMEILGTSGTSQTAIFPNWNNASLTYEDPREAVANGGVASDARMWIDPTSAWGQANPEIGPAWLRTG